MPKSPRGPYPPWSMYKSRFEDVSKIAAKCKDEAKLDRVSNFGMARSILDDLQLIEGQMGVVLQLLAAHDAAEIKSILEDCQLRLIRCKKTINTCIGTTHGDKWKNSFMSVPPLSSFVETQTIRDLRQSLLNSEKPARLVTVHGMGGLGKATACKILAKDAQVRQQFCECIFWIEFGQDTSADAVIDQLVHVTELSGGVETLSPRQVQIYSSGPSPASGSGSKTVRCCLWRIIFGHAMTRCSRNGCSFSKVSRAITALCSIRAALHSAKPMLHLFSLTSRSKELYFCATSVWPRIVTLTRATCRVWHIF
jgi:NB-ARC domain